MLVEAEAGTSILDFKDFVIGDDNTTQAAQISSLQTDVDGLSSTIDTLSADIIRDGEVSTIYAYGKLSGVGTSANYIVPFSNRLALYLLTFIELIIYFNNKKIEIYIYKYKL